MTRQSASTFKVGLVQMRSGLDPAGQSRRAAGGDRRSQARRRRLCADAGNDQYPGAQARPAVRQYRRRGAGSDAGDACAKSRASSAIYIHIGSLAIKASPEKAANRSFLIDRKGDIAARYDKIHMFDVDLAGGESYRESNNYRAGELAVDRRSAMGPARPDGLLRSAFSGALSRAGRGRRLVPRHPVGFHPANRRGALARACMRARAIENGCFVFAAAQGGKHENGRETFGHSLVVDPWGRILAEGGIEPGVLIAEIDPAEVAAARARIPSLLSWPAFRTGRADGRADLSARRAGAAMIRYALVCDQRPRLRKLVSRIRPPTTSSASGRW